MAVRIDAVADQIRRTANVPSNTAFTIMGWSYIQSDLGAGILQPLVWAMDGAVTDGYALHWESGADGSMAVECFDTGALLDGGVFASRPATGTSFAWYIKCAATGTDTLEAGWRGANTNTWVTAACDMGAGVAAVTTIDFGGFAGAYYSDHRTWNVKCWDRVLSNDEITVESYYRRSVFPSSLNFWLPLDLHTDVQDYGGNGRNATTGGTLTTEDSDGQMWTNRPSRKFYSPSGSNPALDEEGIYPGFEAQSNPLVISIW